MRGSSSRTWLFARPHHSSSYHSFLVLGHSKCPPAASRRPGLSRKAEENLGRQDAQFRKRKRPPKRPQRMLSISPVLMRPSIDVPRTILIWLTDAPLHSVAGRTAIPGPPSATAVVAVTWVLPVVIVAVVVGLRIITIAEVALRLHGCGRSNCRRPDKAQCNSC